MHLSGRYPRNGEIGICGNAAVGSLSVLIVDYVLGTATAIPTTLALWFRTDNMASFAVIVLIAGLYVAVQEAQESMVTADMVSADTLAISYGALDTVNGSAKFVSSTAVSVLWTLIIADAQFRARGSGNGGRYFCAPPSTRHTSQTLSE